MLLKVCMSSKDKFISWIFECLINLFLYEEVSKKVNDICKRKLTRWEIKYKTEWSDILNGDVLHGTRFNSCHDFFSEIFGNFLKLSNFWITVF